MSSLQENFLACSPRHQRISTPAASWLIHGGVLALYVLLVARATSGAGLLAWGAGLAYVAYDTALLAFTVVQTRSLVRARTGRVAPHSAARPSVGIVIAAHNEAGSLPRTLAALLRQTDRADEILIADDGSTDATGAALARFGLAEPLMGDCAQSATEGGLRWLRLARGGKARGLNAALAFIETDIVMTVDADTLLEVDAVAAVRTAFAANPALVAATGVLTPYCGPGLEGRLFQWFQTYEYIRNFLSRYAWMRADGLLLISGACAAFRRHAVQEVGGFDPDCLVEDYELIHRLLRFAAVRSLHWHTAVLGGVRARTDAPADIGGFFRQRRRWFGGFLQTQFWYRDMVGNPAYGLLGTWMLPVKAADTLQPIFGLTAFALLLWFIARGEGGVLLSVGGVIGAKILIDLGFHLWSVHLYRRWTGDTANSSFLYALVAALLEPFSFQLLRHTGALLGWVTFLTGQRGWGRSVRSLAVAGE
jgi:cellulose synthase/poly-beta-1,6-N-acetylglucosamine synthase-like glycosyltransferase